MNILFICKYNRFRSRVARAYFDKINKNKEIKTESAGIIRGSYPLSAEQVKDSKELGIDIRGKPKTLSTDLLKKTNMIVITADNVPKEIFKFNGKYPQKIIVWKIKDVKTGKDEKDNKRAIRQIMKKVEDFIKEQENKKWKQ